AQVVHRPRAHRFLSARLAEAEAEHRFAELDRGREEAVAPDPEQHAGTARRDPGGDAGDVAGADRRPQRGHERLERGQHAGRAGGAAAEERAHRFAEPAYLHHTEPQREEDARPEEDDDQDRHEQPVGSGLHEIRKPAQDHRGMIRQMFDRLWQPSTTIDAPLIQLARGDARKATTWPTSSGRPKRPKGSSRLIISAMPCGSVCWRRCHEPPGNMIEPGATLLTRMLAGASWPASALARLISAALTA